VQTCCSSWDTQAPPGFPALLVLREKGYDLWIEPTDEEGELSDYRAEKGGRQFSATCPVSLLGLVAMQEARGDDWRWKPSEPDINDELFESAYPDD
jgi:hypothetical protein